MLEDDRLISELQRGNKEALREIYLKYKDNMLTIAAALLHDSFGAEDVLHDVFVTLASAANRLVFRTNLKNYLIASVANKVHDKYRKKSHNMVDYEKAGQITSQSDGPEQTAIFTEEFQYLFDALYRLPFEQREVIILHLTGDLKFREIADVLGTSTSTIQGRYRYGIEKLRTELNGEYKNDIH